MEVINPVTVQLRSVTTSDFVDNSIFFDRNKSQGDSIFPSSNFFELNLAVLQGNNINSTQILQNNSNLIDTFVDIIDKRLEYIDSLSELSPGWITGTAEIPTTEVTDKVKSILKAFRNHAIMGMLRNVPRLVIGPVPSGGIGIEFHVTSDTALYITLFNDKTVEIEKKIDNFFVDINTDFACLDLKVINFYDDITRE